MNKYESAKRQTVMKTTGLILLLCFVSLMTYKFIAWNYWKVKQSIDVGKQMINAPSAVNLTILQNGKPIFKKSFIPNNKTNRYIITGFDITPYVSIIEKQPPADIRLNTPLQLRINKQPPQDILLRRINQLYAADLNPYHFFFVPRNYGLVGISSLETTHPIPMPRNSEGLKK